MLTRVELELINEIANQNGQAIGAFDLIVRRCGREWSNGRSCLYRLAERGYISLNAPQRGEPLRITLLRRPQ
jgi:hypothetical protein